MSRNTSAGLTAEPSWGIYSKSYRTFCNSVLSARRPAQPNLKMNELKGKSQYIPPVTLHLREEITTSKLYSSAAEGFEAQIASLVEMFLVEVYRCKLCQFTSSIKKKIRTHMANIHERDGIHPSSEISTDPEENDSFGVGDDEVGQENKENEETLEKMSFLLPMYRMLRNMSPKCCAVNLESPPGSPPGPPACQADPLFEEDAGKFQLVESCPVASDPSPFSEGLADSAESKEDEEAQSEHLMSLGLCRISRVKSQASGVGLKGPGLGSRQEAGKGLKPSRADGSASAQPLKDIYPFKGGEERRLLHLCSSCDCEFKSKAALKIHVKCHNRDRGFNCVHCNCYVTEWNLMEKHLQTHKQIKGSYRCPACEKVFVTQSARRMHKDCHGRKPDLFQCTKCSCFYETEHLRNLHMSCHYDDVFKCPHCEFTDKEWTRVHKHLNTHDPNAKLHSCTDGEMKFFRMTEQKEPMSKPKDGRPFLCSLCGQAFKGRRQLSRHHKRAHQKPSVKERKKRRKAEGGLIFSAPEATARSRTNAEEYVCNICNRKCSSKLALQRHMGIHAGVKPFHCHHCDYKTRLKASLIQHMRVHTGEKPFKCEVCPYASIDASSLRRHFRTHTRERPNKCQLCSYSCIQKKSLDLHVRRHHTGEAFSCSFCCYSSPDKQLLRKHTKKHHLGVETPSTNGQPNPGLKPFPGDL
ncbi:zinc finger protein 606-like isoform X1 [Ornithorhynchus anatinus]|uniref:C2H2-type domain-containing protein n=1 Tax=Ornithorhynchus anatinus TaxID=9258 RepID=K7E962_ORNAN|nr:zinc finger protein 606-like isoform X1 [Ornithorhynchus anatinus]